MMFGVTLNLMNTYLSHWSVYSPSYIGIVVNLIRSWLYGTSLQLASLIDILKKLIGKRILHLFIAFRIIILVSVSRWVGRHPLLLMEVLFVIIRFVWIMSKRFNTSWPWLCQTMTPPWNKLRVSTMTIFAPRARAIPNAWGCSIDGGGAPFLGLWTIVLQFQAREECRTMHWGWPPNSCNKRRAHQTVHWLEWK